MGILGFVQDGASAHHGGWVCVGDPLPSKYEGLSSIGGLSELPLEGGYDAKARRPLLLFKVCQ